MGFYEFIAERLRPLCGDIRETEDSLFILVNGEERRLRKELEWEQAYSAYTKAKSRNFDPTDLSFSLNGTIEFPVIRLEPDFRPPDEYTFSDAKGNAVRLHRASIAYAISHFESSIYDSHFEDVVKPRLTTELRVGRSLSALFRRPIAASFCYKGRKIPTNLRGLAIERIKACFVKLAIEHRVSFEFYKKRGYKSAASRGETSFTDTSIPNVSYEENIVSYYKVARSSPFPSQSFLAYYHVLEYYFLQVAEDALHHQLKAYINRTSFKPNSEGLDRVISMVRRQANQENETEMLRKVLQRFVAEDDFIEFVRRLETEHSKPLYSKRRPIFGEALVIALTEGHALSNAAGVLKHVRNAIVHSSDRYKREECHIPLTDSEAIIAEFIPIVRFFAEQVIFGTASPHRF